MVSREPRQIPSSKAGKPSDGLSCFRADLEAVPIGAGTHLDGKFFVWLRQKLLKSVTIPASFFLARQKIFLANLHTVTYWYSFLELLRGPKAPLLFQTSGSFCSLFGFPLVKWVGNW